MYVENTHKQCTNFDAALTLKYFGYNNFNVYSLMEEMMFKIKTNSPEETFNLAETFARYLKPGTLITLAGDLGAGKTLFAKGVAKGLGVTEHVTSPTFTIINEYQGRIPLYHMDVYRLEDEDEIYEMGFEEYFASQGVILIEWAERIKPVMPDHFIDVIIEKKWDDDGSEYRIISFTAVGEEYESLIGEFGKYENLSY